MNIIIAIRVILAACSPLATFGGAVYDAACCASRLKFLARQGPKTQCTAEIKISRLKLLKMLAVHAFCIGVTHDQLGIQKFHACAWNFVIVAL